MLSSCVRAVSEGASFLSCTYTTILSRSVTAVYWASFNLANIDPHVFTKSPRRGIARRYHGMSRARVDHGRMPMDRSIKLLTPSKTLLHTATMSTTPTITCIHGAWHKPTSFGPLVTELEARGLKVDISISLPSTGASPPVPDFTADVAAIQKGILAVLETADCFVVCHSYGTIPAAQALEGLSKSQRVKDGKTTGVVGILIIAGLAMRKGDSMGSQRAEREAEQGVTVSGPSQPFGWPEVSFGGSSKLTFSPEARSF
jgi:hypothetical protein